MLIALTAICATAFVASLVLLFVQREAHARERRTSIDLLRRYEQSNDDLVNKLMYALEKPWGPPPLDPIPPTPEAEPVFADYGPEMFE